MNNPDSLLRDELLGVFYTIMDDFRNGAISEEMFKERLLRLVERYERNFIKKELGADQSNLF